MQKQIEFHNRSLSSKLLLQAQIPGEHEDQTPKAKMMRKISKYSSSEFLKSMYTAATDANYLQQVMDEIDQLEDNCHQAELQLHRLQKKHKQSNLFLNMVVHDMRNPTSSIKMGLETSLGFITKILESVADQ